MDYVKNQKIPIIRTLVSITLALMMAVNIYAIYKNKYTFNDIIPKYKVFTKCDINNVKMLPTIIGPMEDTFNVM